MVLEQSSSREATLVMAISSVEEQKYSVTSRESSSHTAHPGDQFVIEYQRNKHSLLVSGVIIATQRRI